MKKYYLIIGICILAFTGITKAQPKNFTVKVPVELHAIPADLDHFDVAAEVYDRAPASGGYRGNCIGGGNSDEYVITNGEFNDTIVISFDAQTHQDPAKAVYWYVWIMLRKGRSSEAYYMGSDSEYPNDPSKPYIINCSGYINSPAAPQLKKVKYEKVPPVRVIK